MSDFLHTKLGRTGFQVYRLGVAASFGIGGSALEAAVEEHGVNYLYWGSLRRRSFAKAIRALCERGLRDQLFIVVQSYSRSTTLMGLSLRLALRRLGIERADLLLLGWWNGPVWQRIVDKGLQLRERGLTRHLGVSTHERPLVPGFSGESPFDVVHFRYNAAHRGAEQEIFPHLSEGRAGTVAFTATRWGKLLQRPRGAPADVAPLRAGDCYRFVLAQPQVDVCMSGPKNGEQLQEALRIVGQGPPRDDELESMRRFGELVYRA